MSKVADIFYKKGQKKTQYIGSLWENKFADDQREQGNEPWLDLNLSILVGEKRVYATEIRFGKKVLKLGKNSGIYPKVGLVEGLTIQEIDEDDLEDDEEYEDEEEGVEYDDEGDDEEEEYEDEEDDDVEYEDEDEDAEEEEGDEEEEYEDEDEEYEDDEDSDVDVSELED